MARPPPKPELVTRALKLVESMAPAAAAEQLAREGFVVSTRSIQEWAKGKNGARVLVTPGAPLSPPTGPAITIAPAEPPPPMAEAPPVPPELEGVARRLWIIRSRIDATRRALARADVEPGGLGRIGTLTSQLVGLLDEEARLAPPPPPDAHAEERRWRSAADSVIAKIRAGIRVERTKA